MPVKKKKKIEENVNGETYVFPGTCDPQCCRLRSVIRENQIDLNF